MPKILGISAFYHDSAAAILIDGKIIAAAQEERFSRIKHDANFPKEAILFCLKNANISPNELNAVVFYDKPFLKFERLLEMYNSTAPKGVLSFLKFAPEWLGKKLFFKKLLRNALKEIGCENYKTVKLLFTEHHLSHAASAFYPSPFENAAILTIDGVGEWATASIGYGEGSEINLLKELNFPHSLGLFYSAATYFLGFKVNSGEYKLMGLAPYGNPSSEQTLAFEKLILEHLIHIYNDGSIWLNPNYFSYTHTLHMVPDKKWEALFKIPKRKEGGTLEQHHCNLALAFQNVTEMVVLKMATEAKQLTNCKNLCLAGGVALNCVANGVLEHSKIFENIWIQPAAGDAGGALGAALAVHCMYFNDKVERCSKDGMQGSLLGPQFTRDAIVQMNKTFKAVARKSNNWKDLTDEVANHLLEGKVVGWFQGRMEFGPRALGNRSILANPMAKNMQKTLNLKIKKREAFRPFAPAVLEEDVTNYFQLESKSPYMLKVVSLNDELRKELPNDYFQKPLLERLYTDRSDLQAITHIDFSARVQTVNKSTNTKFWELLNKFKMKSGHPILVNTSFNVRGEPIVCSPTDAYLCFMTTEMDFLIIEDYIYTKEAQIHWHEAMEKTLKHQLD